MPAGEVDGWMLGSATTTGTMAMVVEVGGGGDPFGRSGGGRNGSWNGSERGGRR